MIIKELPISSPKRDQRSQNGWDGFFPYYAGYPETFARGILGGAGLRSGAVILDPWNGSGTTTFAAAHLGFKAIGLDLNPVMVIVSRARTLPFSEIDALEPLAKAIISGARNRGKVDASDPLFSWFEADTVLGLRSIERSICKKLVGSLTLSASSIDLQKMSSIAAAFYVALFAVARELSRPFQSSNPTWLKRAKDVGSLVAAERTWIDERFVTHVVAMANVLAAEIPQRTADQPIEIRVADSTSPNLARRSVDAVLTSPPYCTRIDYTAATRVELAIISPLVPTDTVQLGRAMIGSTRVAREQLTIDPNWGPTCRTFLKKIRKHPSKASNGYYLKTHLDYFDKMSRSLSRISAALKPNGAAILVVQDSFYKEIHNDLPQIMTEIAAQRGLRLKRREDFYFRRSMSGINPKTKNYNRRPGAVESVLCFEK
jgi:DNA modification methylase